MHTYNVQCRQANKRDDPSALCAERTKHLAVQQMQEIRCQPNESKKSAAKTKFGMKDDDNPMFSLSVDLFRYVIVACTCVHYFNSLCILRRSTPVEVLHSILLGPYKYLLKTFIPRLSPTQKRQVLAKMSAFNYSGFKGKVIGNLISYHKSFVGRDYKAWAQLDVGEKKIWPKVHVQSSMLLDFHQSLHLL